MTIDRFHTDSGLVSCPRCGHQAYYDQERGWYCAGGYNGTHATAVRAAGCGWQERPPVREKEDGVEKNMRGASDAIEKKKEAEVVGHGASRLTNRHDGPKPKKVKITAAQRQRQEEHRQRYPYSIWLYFQTAGSPWGDKAEWDLRETLEHEIEATLAVEEGIEEGHGSGMGEMDVSYDVSSPEVADRVRAFGLRWPGELQVKAKLWQNAEEPIVLREWTRVDGTWVETMSEERP